MKKNLLSRLLLLFLIAFTLGLSLYLSPMDNREEISDLGLSETQYAMVNNPAKMCNFSPSVVLVAIQPIANGAWNQASTWPGRRIPTINDDVTIPADRIITLAGTCRAKTIQVLGVLKATNQSIDLETESLVISGASGKLEIGTETQPYDAAGKCLITLRGTKANVANENHKAITVMAGGKLELHGKKRRSWTNLIATADARTKTLVLKEAVDWERGDIIALTSTSLADEETKSWENVDQVEIDNVSPNGRTITLKDFLNFKHIGGSKTYTRAVNRRTWNVNIQGEVGLLSHYIKIQGKMDGTNQADGFGGHIMIMKGGMAKVEHVELFRMGQRGIKARYPFHWHLCEDKAEGSYFKNSSVHRSFNRAVVIHGTNSVTVDGIFAYDHIGHGIFLEDGSEQLNTIKNNVVFVTRRPKAGEQVTPSDNEFNTAQNRTPSSYWITNPNNYFENNVAAGTEGTGFWIATPDGAPMGASAQIPLYKNINPSAQNILRFKGFVAHTCMNGWDIFDGLNPDHSIKKNFGLVVTTDQFIEDGLFYGNNTALYSGLGNGADPTKLIFRNCAFSDNEITTMLAADLTLENCMFNGDSGLGVFTGNRYFFRFYDGPGRHRKCHFENWNKTYTYMIHQRPGGGATENFNPSFKETTKGFSEPFVFNFYPLPNNDETRARRLGQFFKDYDGGLTGKAHTTIVRDIPFLLDGHEKRFPSWINAVRSDYYFASLGLVGIDATDTQISVVRSKTGTVDACFYDSGADSSGTYTFPMIVNQKFLYTYHFSKVPYEDTGSSSRNIKMIWSRGDTNDYGLICLKGFGKLKNFTIKAKELVLRSSTAAVVSANTDTNSYFIDAIGDVYLKMRANGDNGVEFELDWTGVGDYKSTALPCSNNGIKKQLRTSLPNTDEKEFVDEGVSVYPNPSKDGIFFLSKEIDYEVYDTQGRTVIVKKKDSKIDLSAKADGVYILHFGSSNIKLIK